MADLIQVLTDLSGVLGVPAVLGIAWVFFILRDHGRRIESLEKDLDDNNDKWSEELSKIYDRINSMSSDIAYIRGKIEKDDK